MTAWFGSMTAQNVIALAAVLVNLGALIFLARQVRLAVDATKQADQNRLDEWAQKRREVTLQTYMGTIERREKYKEILPSDRDKDAVDAAIAKAPDNPLIDNAIRDYMNYYEMVATGVNSKVLDIEVINRFGGTSLVHAWNKYLPWIMRQRRDLNAPTVSCEFEKLAEEVARLRKMEYRTPAEFEAE